MLQWSCLAIVCISRSSVDAFWDGREDVGERVWLRAGGGGKVLPM